LLTRRLLQLEAPSDGDDATMVGDTEGEPSEVQEITEGHAQAESPQKDIKANVNTEKAEV
jgi:hypothetical protein